MTKKLYKHKLLLDENLPPRSDFSQLNNKFDLKHIDHDLKHGGASDPEVYKIAVKQKRIILTRNIKHFKILSGSRDGSGIIGIPPHWNTSQIDTKLIAFLAKHTPKSLSNKFISLVEED